MRLLIVLAALVASTIAGPYENEHDHHYRGPPAPLSKYGMVMDTPEVAHARAVHLAVHAQALTQLRNARKDYDVYDNSGLAMMMPERMPEMTEAPVATKRQHHRHTIAPLAPDGRVVDTPEVAAAKSAHMAAHARAASKASEFYELNVFDGRKNLVYLAPLRVTYNHATPIVYRGPLAPLGADGRVIDTPEVARAREAHMKAHARAAAMSTKNDLYY